MKRVVLGGVLALVGVVSTSLVAQQQRAALPELTKVKDNYYVIFASSPVDRTQFTGGNTGVFITERGVVVVDTKLAGYGADILARIRRITSKPVTTIINTHSHGDHNGSNEGFAPTVDIVAHENTKANMLKMDAFAGDKAKFLPKRTFTTKLSIGAGKDQIDLYYFGAGHTSGDTWVAFPAIRTLQAGDMFAWKDAPLLDRANGGSGVEFPKTIAKAIAGIPNIDTVVPGHSPVMAPRDLQEYQNYTADLLAQVEAAKKAGKTADQALAGLNLSKYAGYRTDRLKAAVDALYTELP
jgi:glyoxylase-like metal-dependent hydrolase (beta-lactamase superfamily II)